MKKASKKLPKAKDGIFRKREWTNTVAPDDSVVSTRTNRRGAKITVVTDDKGKRVSRTKETPAQQRYNERFGEEIKALGYKTGGVVNSNKKVKAIKVAGSKGGAKKPLRKAQFGKTVTRSVDSNEYGSTAEIDKTNKKGKSKVKTIEISNTGSSPVIQSSIPTARIDVRKYDAQGMDTAKPKSKEISTNRAQRIINRQAKKATVMKTGGMVNANAKVSALKTAGSKGVKSGVNPKASASKRATGRSGGTSTAPKTAVPKAKYGMVMRRK